MRRAATSPETLLHAILHAAREDPHRRDAPTPPGSSIPPGEQATGGWGAHRARRRARGNTAVSATAAASSPAGILPRCRVCPIGSSTSWPSRRDTYKQMVAAFKDAGCRNVRRPVRRSTTWTHPGRSLPDGVAPERFE